MTFMNLEFKLIPMKFIYEFKFNWKKSSIFYIFYDLHVKKKTIAAMFICSANTAEFDLFSISIWTFTIYVYKNTFFLLFFGHT